MHIKLWTTIALSCIIATSCLAQSEGSDDNSGKSSELPTGLHMNESGQVKLPVLSVLSVAPFQFTETGVGFAISYEHSIDKTGIVTYTIPFVSTFDLTNTHHTSSMYYLMPGLKFYPTSWKGKVKYAVGPSVAIGAGKKYTDYNFDTYLPPYSSTIPVPFYTEQDRFTLAVMVNNYLNFFPTHHLFIGVEFGLGFSYINRLGGNNDGMMFVSQGGFKMGYRF